MPPQLPSFIELSNQTPFPGNLDAAYEQAFDDPMAQQVPMVRMPSKDPKFHHNLARYIGEQHLNKIGNDLQERIEKDMADRQGWINVIKQGIDYLGIGASKSKTTQVAKNADIYSATLLTIALRTTSKIHSSLFPANGFIETEIKGFETDDILDRANRIKEYFNYFFRDVAEEYVPDKKQAIWWMVLDGSVFSKVYFDRIKGRPVGPYVRAEEIIINTAASSLDDAERITHEFVLTEREYRMRVEAGEYRDVYLETADVYENKIKQTIDSKIGVNNTPDDNSKVYQIHEVLCYLDIDGFNHQGPNGEPDGKPLPFIVTKDKNSNSILSIYRNWNEDDITYKLKNFYVQHKYFTGFNIYGLGLFHLLLGYAKAETELQQQLLKAAQLANAPVLLQATGLRQERTQLDVKPGGINYFNSFGTDFNNNIKPLGFHDPSPVMLELKKMLSDGMEQVSVARQISPENIPTNTSATTMLGVLSTMHILEDSLMNDLYTSFKKELGLFYNLFAEWVPDEPYPFAVPGGEYAVMRQDFQPCIAIRPSLDPNASSTTFQLILNETINGLSQQQPDLYDTKEVHKRMLRAMKVNDIEKLFKTQEPPPPPPALDPISESKAAMMGQPIKAYKWQDHPAYIAIESSTIAQLQADESQDHTASISELQGIIQERKAMMYMADMEVKIGRQLPDDPSKMPPAMQNEIAMIAAQKIAQDQAQEKKDNPPPIDPSAVLMEENRIKEKGIEFDAQKDQMQNQFDQMKLQQEQQQFLFNQEVTKLELQMKQEKAQKEAEIDKAKIELEIERVKLEHLRLQLESQGKAEALGVQRDKADLDAESRAFDSTLRYEKDLAAKEESPEPDMITE